MFKFKDLQSTMSFLWTLFIYLFMKHAYNYTNVINNNNIHDGTVVINTLQNLQSAISRAVLHIARPSVRLSPFVRPYVTRMDQSKTVGEDYAR